MLVCVRPFGSGAIAVLGVLFQHAAPGDPADAAVAKLLTHINDEGGKGGKHEVTVQPGALWEDTSGYWEWKGSLTTPPCTGDVRWMLQRRVGLLQHSLHNVISHRQNAFNE